MDEVTCAKNRVRMEQWTALIRDCKSSGMKVEAWCAANGVSRDSSYYWLRKLRKAALEQNGMQNIPANSSKVTFSRLEVADTDLPSRPSVTLKLSSATIEITNGVSLHTLEAVLLALKETC